MDNLNTHAPASLCKAFPPDKAPALCDRFGAVHLPKHGSWLNMAKIEINAMARQCLNRCIADSQTLRSQVTNWQASRDQDQDQLPAHR